MARHNFLIRYSNGFKRHVSRTERDILTDSLQQIGPREYLSKDSLQFSAEQLNGPSYLPGVFSFELKGKRHRELMQSVQGLVRDQALRLAQDGARETHGGSRRKMNRKVR